MTYRTNKKLELQKRLDRFADDEAELEAIARDFEATSQYQEAEDRLRIKGLDVIERDDIAEAKQYVDDLLEQTQKAVQARKEKRAKRMKFAAKVVGVTTAVLSVGYGIAKISKNYQEQAAQEKQEEKQKEEKRVEERGQKEKELNFYNKFYSHLMNVADVDCDGKVQIKEFSSFYKAATGKNFFQSLNADMNVSFDFKVDAKSIKIESHNYTMSITLPNYGREDVATPQKYYKIILPTSMAEQLLQYEGNDISCEMELK